MSNTKLYEIQTLGRRFLAKFHQNFSVFVESQNTTVYNIEMNDTAIINYINVASTVFTPYFQQGSSKILCRILMYDDRFVQYFRGAYSISQALPGVLKYK